MEMANPQQNDERFSGKHLRIAKENGNEGLVILVSLLKTPEEIKDIKGRRILYQKPVGDCGDDEYQIVYFIPESQKDKIALLPPSCIKKVYRILACKNGSPCGDITRKLGDKGLFLEEISFR
ncbi:MAG: hypothetical protein ACLFNR_00430 [Candidatus Paceibacterota bacterium]